MIDTKERILQVALRLFAKDGYEAVSVSQISSALGITKGALYKHYKNKRAIFDTIVERIIQLDEKRSKDAHIPESTYKERPDEYGNLSFEELQHFMEEQFKFWSSDELGVNFRKMLELEQYRDKEMFELYQNIFSSGPVSYIEDVFQALIEQGMFKGEEASQLAIEYYSPFYLLLNYSNSKADVERIFNKHLNYFADSHILSATNKQS